MNTVENKNNQNASIRPWFNEPMVWMVIAIPFSAVLVGSFMLTMSIKSYDGLVVDDYYKQGKEINRVLTRNENARRYNLTATVSMSQSGQLVVGLHHSDDFSLPENIEFKFLHRTRAGKDQVHQLTRYADGLYRISLPQELDGIWKIQLETGDWRIVGNATLPQDSHFTLSYL